MRVSFFSFLLITFLGAAWAQPSVISNNKPLALLNPALQNYALNKGVASLSTIVNPFVQEPSALNYLALAEVKLTDELRVGLHGSKVDNRLNANSMYKVYASYRLELEKGNYLLFGLDAGGYQDVFKPNEFNKVLAPNKFVYADTIETGLDLGFGVAYNYSGFTFGIGFSKLNRPPVVQFPEAIWELNSDSSAWQLKDTTVNFTENNGTFGLQSNVNVMYEWELNEDLQILHSLQFGNIDLAGVDYIGFQNIATIKDRHSLGLGGYYNGSYGIIVTAGYGFTEAIQFEATAFFTESLNYDTGLGRYVSEGYRPAIEANLRYEF